MRRLLLLIILLSGAFGCYSQSWGSRTLLTEIPGNWIDFEVDNLSNCYLISANGQLKKYDAKGETAIVYNDQLRYGTIAKLDVSNPMRLLVHYADYNTVVWLDRFLKPLHTVDLRASGIVSAKSVAGSFDGKIWVYDEWEHSLKKIDSRGELLQKTPDLRQVLGEEITPLAIFDCRQRVYCYDSLKGVYVFDYYGNFEKKISLKGWSHFAVTASGFIGQKEHSLLQYELSSETLSSWMLTDINSAGKIVVGENGNLYSLVSATANRPGGLLIFKK